MIWAGPLSDATKLKLLGGTLTLFTSSLVAGHEADSGTLEVPNSSTIA